MISPLRFRRGRADGCVSFVYVASPPLDGRQTNRVECNDYGGNGVECRRESMDMDSVCRAFTYLFACNGWRRMTYHALRVKSRCNYTDLLIGSG